MTLKFLPSTFGGILNSFPSKSFAIRAIFAATLAKGQTIIENVGFCKDVKAAIYAAKSLGAKIIFLDGILKIYGANFNNIKKGYVVVNCFDSALVLRILIFLASTFQFKLYLKVNHSLLNRPYICDILFNGKKFIYAKKYKNFILPKKKLNFGKFEVDSSFSSQFLTGLFFSLPILKGNSEIIIKSAIVSKNYIKMTIAVLKDFGIEIKKTSRGFKVFGNQKYRACSYFVEGDYSLAAFFCVLGVFSPIKIGPFKKNSVQGEKIFLDILQFSGAKVSWNDGYVEVFPKKKLKPFIVNLKNIPDLAPILAVFACFCCGRSFLFGVKNLVFKESNRIESVVNLLNSIGGVARYIKKHDVIEIDGGKKFSGGFVDGCFDHRIVMAAAICSSFSFGPIVVSCCESVFKSYLTFFKDYFSLGGRFCGVGLE